jgi:uncharacterized membrane protein (UPF0127 family)
VVPFWPSSVERITHNKGLAVRTEPLTLLPLVPYYVDATDADHTISLKNTGAGFSAFQKIVPRPPIKGPQPELPTMSIVIESKGKRNTFMAEVALTLIQQAVGLMFRPSLAPDRGMIFAWITPREVAMYMRNVRVPLDFLFIDEKLAITHIHENAAPGDLTAIHSNGKVVLTLEVPGGTVARLGIAKGDLVL